MLNNHIPHVEQSSDRLAQLMQMQIGGGYKPNTFGLVEGLLPKQQNQRSPTPQEIEETLDSDLLFRWLYVPFVAAVIFWDRVDTARDMCKLLNLQDKKRITRELMNFYKEFKAIRNLTFHGDGNQEKAGERLIDEMEKDLNEVYNSILTVLSKQFPDLHGDKMYMVAAIHEALAVHSAICKYNLHYQKLLKKEYGYTTRDPLPKPFVLARKQMMNYFPHYMLPIDSGIMGICSDNILQTLFDIQLFDNNGELEKGEKFKDYVNKINQEI